MNTFLPRRDLDLLVFDWDGTLMDSTATIVQAMQAAFRDAGMEAPPPAACRFVIGYALDTALRHLAPHASAAQLQALSQGYRKHYVASEQQLVLFDGVMDALPRLCDAGYLLAIATGKARAGLNRMLELTGIGQYFTVSRCSDEAFSKPHPAMLEYILDFTAIDAGRALMIGDTTHDMELANNAGTHCAALSYGAHAIDKILPLQPVAHFDDFPSLTDWLLKEKNS